MNSKGGHPVTGALSLAGGATDGMVRPMLRIVPPGVASFTSREQRLQGLRRAAHTIHMSKMISAGDPLLSQMAFEPAKPVESGPS